VLCHTKGSPSLNNAKIASVTRDNAADAKCFRYQAKFSTLVITIILSVITNQIGISAQ
jgi:hypothetical protein